MNANANARPFPRAVPDPSGRLPPHSLDAERAVLAACLLSQSALESVAGSLLPEHFFAAHHQNIYAAACEVLAAPAVVDPCTVLVRLRERGEAERAGGAGYLAELCDATPAVAHVESHARIVRDKHRLRTLIATCQRIAAEGYGDTGDASTFLAEAEATIAAIIRAAGDDRDTAIALRDSLRETFEAIQAAAAAGQQIIGLSTGFRELDALTGGLHPGEVTIIGGRPGMGKSSLAATIALRVSSLGTGTDHVVAFYSLEMPHAQLSLRTICTETRIDLARARTGRLTDLEWARMAIAAQKLARNPMILDDVRTLSPLELRSKCKRLQARAAANGACLALVVVDYLQLMRPDVPSKQGSREQDVAANMRALKVLAGDLNVPVIVCAQVNRESEKRRSKDHRPQLSDLRESGSIEQDADNVVFVHREEYYQPGSAEHRGQAELIVAKQRNGPMGTARTRFHASCALFADDVGPSQGAHWQDDEC